MFESNRKMIVHVVGILTGLFAISPFLYGKLDNVKDTGDKATDDIAEGLHDMGMGLLTFYTTLKAIVIYIVARVVIMMIPDSILGDK